MQFYFEEMRLWKDRKENVFRKINDSGYPLVLFGKSEAINENFLCQIHVPVQYICDNDPGKWGTELWGKEVIPPVQLQEVYTNYNVLILVPYEDEIIPQLQELPSPPVEIFFLDLYFEEEDTVSYYQSVKSEIIELEKRLADQRSRDIYEALIHYRVNRNPDVLRPFISPKAQEYFPDRLDLDRFSLKPNEIFVDAGAFIGDTVEAFLRASGKKYAGIYAFEPDPGNFKRMLQTICEAPDVTLLQSAVGDHAGKLRFSSGGITARANETGDLNVPMDTLDHMLDGIPVTYIKMDLEGMECSALRGAKKLIQTYHPKLAICTYHSNADMLNVPKTILDIAPDYQLYFRHYSHALVDTICYALPQNEY